ncbi:deoxyuridine 5 -triphosphate nucleotidohydrolase-like [Olea europaea subsp. europaea]|uniref:Deoxyuridine 5'-triphosphate nucleotidohydrolase n=2 Tax=Olea europaea subsp. europaea TaxID=158383 RepID=A0A8S0ULJ3_OLEEU|nr:deoxyuridine 5 -triphosphate nucleotidohydrolase-like [Olea europaea subsp. europaea]
MAGILGAIFPNPAFFGNFHLFSSTYPSSKSFKPLSICNYARSPHKKICPFTLEMAQTVANHNPEIKEPNPKIPKLQQNGDPEAPHEITSFLRVKKLSEKAVLPSRASPLSAGYDLSSAIETKVPARGKALIPTDLSIAIPEGTYARIAPRSGLAWKHSIDVGAGVIDADYRGPIGVILFNHSDVDFEVKAADRIAQLIIEKILTPEVTEVDDLDSTIRGSGGFGSTGV